MIKQTILNLAVGILIVSCAGEAQISSTDNSGFVDSLMNEMTLEEKIGQLNLPSSGAFTTGEAANSDIAGKIKKGQVGGLFNIQQAARIREVQKVAVEQSRLGIPLIFAMDVIHGYKTIFPIPLGLSCSWDTELIEKTARTAAREVSADGIAWTFSPMVDISRDPRWGRVAEGNGEDPYLASEIAQAMVRGYQGDDLRDPTTIMSCVKHFALYGAAEAGRDYNTTDMSRLRMYNDYFPPYKAAVDAGVGSVMTSFNEVDGIPASGNRWLMTEILREAWGFDGMVVTDYTAINEMIDHGMGDLQQVSALALKAGSDMDMVGEGYLTTLKKSLEEGSITEADIDRACKRILEAKYKLGLFEDPYRYCDEERGSKEIFSDENRQFARETAAQTFVLLKNEDNILPLKKGGTIALVGPMADNKLNMNGTWSVAGQHDKAISLKEGITNVAGDDVKIVFAKGANIVKDAKLESRISVFGKSTYRDDRSEDEMIKEALEAAKQADVIVAAMGEASEMSGESSSRSDIELPATQRKLLKALLETGKPVAMVLFTGRPLAIKWEDENVPAILNVWFAGSQAGDAIADVLFGDVNPSGKLTATFPQNVGQVPIYYSHKNTGRPLADGKWFQKFRSNYLDVTNEPLYPFGYGLSYTTFDYKNLNLSGEEISMDGELKVSVEVTNTGTVDGAEIVQLYIRDLVGSITRPVKQLKGFEKVKLAAGETKTVEFTLTENDLAFYHHDMTFKAEPGKFKVFVGPSSAEGLEGEFTLN
ncbi:beta-glucosidase BglX [Fulvivirga sp. RKSG066]|uniref:beta-glucosidase BglX n=1 Tax=Fulvivirga aurantia TaxID=2529383 RepID=UPI0012BB5EC5|nr:beta-glucosidase BglX [Fulvivirga aurantia]MTI21713.1 beta-glucosidase BglX [Fulvivirga aurantia]